MLTENKRPLPSEGKSRDDLVNREVFSFTADRVDEVCDLNQAGLFTYSILAGSDYDERGLLGSGSVTSYGIAASGICDELFHSPDDVAGWKGSVRIELRRLQWRASISTREHNVLSRMPEFFPSQEVVDLYWRPTTSYSTGSPRHRITFDEPYIRELAEFCRDELHMKPSDIPWYFERHLWEGVVLALIRSVSISTFQLNLC